MDIQVKRGINSKRTALTPLDGEPVFTTDTKELFIGDGSTQGGIPVGTVKTEGNVAQGMIAHFKDATGRLLYGITKSDLFKGYATEQFVTSTIANSVPAVKVNNAKVADKATDADSLKGRSDYLTPDVLTDSYTENSPTKVVVASAINSLYTTLKGFIDNLTLTKLNKTDVTSDLSSSSTAKAASAGALKTVNDKIDPIDKKAAQAITLATKASQDVAAAKASGDAAQSIANEVKVQAANNKAHLDNLPPKVSSGASAPTGGTNGDVYLQYK